MINAAEVVDMGARLRAFALPLYRGDLNAASLFAHDHLMRVLIKGDEGAAMLPRLSEKAPTSDYRG